MTSPLSQFPVGPAPFMKFQVGHYLLLRDAFVLIYLFIFIYVYVHVPW